MRSRRRHGDAASPLPARRHRRHRLGAAAPGRGERARALLGGPSSRLACASIERLPFAERAFGLIWSNLALGWTEDALSAFRELNRVLEPGGLLTFSAYGPDTLVELRRAFHAVDPGPHVHRFIDMHDIGDMLLAAGFAAPVVDMETLTLTYADVPALLGDLRRTGQSNTAGERRRGLSGRGLWQGMLAAYERERRDGRIPATMEIVYGHAWKGEPRRDDGRAPIRFEPRSSGDAPRKTLPGR